MHPWLPLIALAAICVALLVPIATWQAYMRGRSLWGWSVATLALGGMPLLILPFTQRTVYAPDPKTALASFWPRLGWMALFMLLSILMIFASVAALLCVSGQSAHDALRFPF